MALLPLSCAVEERGGEGQQCFTDGSCSGALLCFHEVCIPACPGNRDPASNCVNCLPHWVDQDDDCGTCLGNWDLAQGCQACENHWVDDGSNDCGTCPGNWDPAQDCAACKDRWADQGDDCGTCPERFEVSTGCSACAPGWAGPDCDQPYCQVHDCWTVPPTGVTECYASGVTGTMECAGVAGDEDCAATAMCGQDAQYPDPARTFSVRTEGGVEVVEDSLSGLLWERNPANDEMTSVADARARCEGLEAGSLTDWRLPTVQEFASILDWDNPDGVLPAEILVDAPHRYWLEDNLPGDTDIGCGADLVDEGGGIQLYYHSGLGLDGDRALCVHGAGRESAPADRFSTRLVEGKKLLSDNATGLQWADLLDLGDLDLENQCHWCEGLAFGGFTDWRAPDIQELLSVARFGAADALEVFEIQGGLGSSLASTTTDHRGNSYSLSGVGGLSTCSGMIFCVRGGR
ncbi:MAG TPA: DUF1566 domain-containing protein [Myxococcota bacterium]|nr:DUF1566 domain-containing protein [Myxococcota bacterium]HRY93715.1 DUF1566 domain-containing protein [Myxococcota bacterium]